MNTSTLFKTHSRVVTALIVREMSTRFGNKVGGYLWAILDPVAHIALLTLLFSAIARNPPLGTDFAMFFASGYLALQYWQAMTSQIAGAISANKPLLIYPIVSPIDVVVSRYILQLLTTSLVTLSVISACILASGYNGSIDYLPLIEASFLASLMGAGVGMINIVAFKKSSLYEKVYGIITRPLFIVSGVFFLPDSIPMPYREYLLFNPLAHIIIWFRSGIYPYYKPAELNEQYVLIFTALTFLLGFVCFTIASRGMRS